MTYHQYEEDSDLPQNWEEYHAQYGNTGGQPGWENLSRPERDWIKKGRSPYQSYTEDEQRIMGEIHADIAAGSPADISGLEDLTERYQMSPGIRQWFIKRVGKLLGGGADYQDVYKAQKGKLDVAAREQERGIMERGAATGLLDSSATQAQLGGMRGGYQGALADLLMGTRAAEERTRSTKFGQGVNLMRTGLDWQQTDIQNKTALETLRNMLYGQDIGFKAAGLDYLGQERARENAYQQGEVRPWDPMTGGEMIPGLLTGGLEAFLATQTGGASTLLSDPDAGYTSDRHDDVLEFLR